MTILSEKKLAHAGEISAELVRIAPKPESIERQRLRHLAAWLESGAPPKLGVDGFDMCDYIDPEAECGTTCCIAGAAVMFFDDGISDIEQTWNIKRRAARTLGLSHFQADDLFTPSCGSGAGPYFLIKPERAAKVIRHFLESGRIDWRIA